MCLRSKMSEVFDQKFFEQGLTYDQAMEITGLSRSQVYQILKKNGKRVSAEKIWGAVLKIDPDVEMDIKW